jgi:hypothetical protein
LHERVDNVETRLDQTVSISPHKGIKA